MNITKLSIRNFLTIGHAEVDLDARGLLLIQGENLDDPSARSNGAGKSSVVDALVFCLFGSTAREVSGDAVVNETAKKDCSVCVELDDGGETYRIERYRKHATKKNVVLVFKTTGGVVLDLSKGTDRETQFVINKVIGCSAEVFAAAIYCAQEKMPDLPGMTDKFLKLLVEEAAGVEELSAAYALAQKQSVEATKAFSAASSAYGTAEKLAGAAQAQLDEAAEQVELFEDGRKDRARAELSKVLPLASELTLLGAQHAALDHKALESRKSELTAELASHSAQQVEMTRLDRVQAAAETAQTVAKNELLRLKNVVVGANASLLELDRIIGTPCGECGKVYCEHDLAAAETTRTAIVTDAIAAQNAQVTKCKAAIAQAIGATVAAGVHRDSLTDVSATSAELATATAALTEFRRLTTRIGDLQASIATHKLDAQGKMKEGNPWVPIQARRIAMLIAAQADQAAAKVAVEVAVEAAELAGDAVKVFGPAGVRAHIIDTVTPFLNARTADYLGALSDGNIHAVWNTLEKNAKGELKEKFNIAVSNDKGGKTFAAQSGGEKRKVRLACALALQDMVASRASKPINLFLADEIDDAMDPAGLERLMGVLEKKAKERGTVLIISHNSLADWCDQVITVTKSGGLSSVSGAAIRGF